MYTNIYICAYLHIQVEFLKSVAGGADGEADDETKAAINEGQWERLIEETDPKIVEDLEALFVQYDDDDSGELEMEEVRQLVAQLGTQLSDQEAANLFRVMDADGSVCDRGGGKGARGTGCRV
jgi:hypothetical protein